MLALCVFGEVPASSGREQTCASCLLYAYNKNVNALPELLVRQWIIKLVQIGLAQTKKREQRIFFLPQILIADKYWQTQIPLLFDYSSCPTRLHLSQNHSGSEVGVKHQKIPMLPVYLVIVIYCVFFFI